VAPRKRSGSRRAKPANFARKRKPRNPGQSTRFLGTDKIWKISTDGGAQAIRVLEGLTDYRNLAVVENGLMFVPTRNTSSLQFLNFVTGKITLLAYFDRGQARGVGMEPRRGSYAGPDAA